MAEAWLLKVEWPLPFQDLTMLESITLQNFKSFGAAQRVPLEAISVLVGPNNSGKSNFLSVGAVVREIAGVDASNQFLPLDPLLFHRPPVGDGRISLTWAGDGGCYEATIEPSRQSQERVRLPGSAEWLEGEILYQRVEWMAARSFPSTLTALRRIRQGAASALLPVVAPLLHSHDVKLSIDALRSDSLLADAQLGPDGSNLAAVVNRWRSSEPDKSEEFDAVLRSYVPEVRRVLAPATRDKKNTHFRLEFEQTDGEKFDSQHVSDGVLFFAGLVAHVIDAGPSALILMEEPENSIHPRRLHDLVELLKRLAADKKCQFVVATHAPSLLDEFRDEPEAILLFRRGQEGTVVRPLAQVPDLLEALSKIRPGEMMASGFFNDRF